jgi:hypothetical protein
MSVVSRILTALMITALVVPAAAAARLRTIAPPGNPAISQYLETIPTDKGQSPTSSRGTRPGVLSSAQRQTLDHAGTNGRTLVSVVNATSPSPVTTAGSRVRKITSADGAAGSLPEAALSGRGAASPAGSLLAAAGGDGGIDVFLPVLLGAAVLGVIARAVVRWRRTRAS